MQQEKTSTCTSGSNGQPSAPSPINLASAKWISCSTTVLYCSLRLTKTIAFAAAAVNDVIELYTLVWAKRLQLTMGDDDEEKSNSFSASFNLTLNYLSPETQVSSVVSSLFCLFMWFTNYIPNRQLSGVFLSIFCKKIVKNHWLFFAALLQYSFNGKKAWNYSIKYLQRWYMCSYIWYLIKGREDN